MPMAEKGKRGVVDARQLIDMLRGRCGNVVIEKVGYFPGDCCLAPLVLAKQPALLAALLRLLD